MGSCRRWGRSDWQNSRLGDHVSPLSGFPFSSSAFSSEEGFPLIRIRDLLDGKTNLKYTGKYETTYVVKKDDLLIGMDGDFHLVKWKGKDALLNQRILKLIENRHSDLCLDFLFYWLDPFLIEVNEKTAATTVKHLSTYDVVNAIVNAPAYEQQKKIAKILSAVDNLIEKTQALIDKYTSIKQGMMADLFTRGIDLTAGPNYGKLRPNVEDAPELYKESELGWVPKEWEVGLLGDHLKRIEQGWSPDCETEPANTGQWGVLKTTAVVWEGYNSLANKALPEGLNPRLEYEVNSGDVLMTRAGPGNRVGVVAYVNSTQNRLILSDKLYRMVPNESLNKEYLSLFLSSALSMSSG